MSLVLLLLIPISHLTGRKIASNINIDADADSDDDYASDTVSRRA